MAVSNDADTREARGVNRLHYALPNCPRCKGRGLIAHGDGPLDCVLCGCVELGHHMAVAERRIRETFPERARKMTFETFQTGGDPKNEKALRAAKNFVDHYPEARREGWIVGFWGPPSAGKTHLAYATVIACIKRYRNIKPAVLNVSQMLRMERKTWNREDPDAPRRSPIDLAMTADLLALDDLGAEYGREASSPGAVTWVIEALYQILDERIMHQRPTIYTTNLSPTDLQRRLDTDAGQRVWERIRRAEVAPAIEVVPVASVNRPNVSAAAKLFT